MRTPLLGLEGRRCGSLARSQLFPFFLPAGPFRAGGGRSVPRNSLRARGTSPAQPGDTRQGCAARRGCPGASGGQAVTAPRRTGRDGEKRPAEPNVGRAAGKRGGQRGPPRPEPPGPGSWPALRGKAEAPRAEAPRSPALAAPRARPGSHRGQRQLRHPSQPLARFRPLGKGDGGVLFFFSLGPFAGRRDGKVVRFAQVARGGLCATVD